MNRITFKMVALVLSAVLVGCPTEIKPALQDTDVFNTENAWTQPIPPEAKEISADEFRNKVASGELVLTSDKSIEAQKKAREAQFQADQKILQGIPDLDPNTQALLKEAASNPNGEADRTVTLSGGQTVVLLGLGASLRNAVEAQKASQSADNALSNYQLSYTLLPAALKTNLPTPESLNGQSVSEINAALKQLNEALRSPVGLKSLQKAYPEPSNGTRLTPQVAPIAGNGRDEDITCAAPRNIAARYWFPLKNFVSPIKNQGMRGTCWAFAGIGALESREMVQNNNRVNLSEQFLVNQVKGNWAKTQYGDGGSAKYALDAAVDKNQSLPLEAFWTYNPASERIDTDNIPESYGKTCNGYDGSCSKTAHQSPEFCANFGLARYCGYSVIDFAGPGVSASNVYQSWKNGEPFYLEVYRQYLAEGHTLLASFPLYRGFDSPSAGGIVNNYDKTTWDNDKKQFVDGSRGNHVVQIVGFLSNSEAVNHPSVGGGGYFIIKNSWGCRAGDGGYYYIPADYVSRLFNEFSVIKFSGRSDAWNQEQATPGGTIAPTIKIETNPARADLRAQTYLGQFFSVSHPVATGMNLTVTSNVDGPIYNGPWSTNSLITSLPKTFATLGQRTINLIASYGSKQTQSSFVVNVVNTPPTLNLQYAGLPSQNEPFTMNANLTDINEPNLAALCPNTTWAVDAPDTLSSTTGCEVKVTFKATGTRQVRVNTRDSDGATASATVALTVKPPLVNPYPRIKSSGVFSREFTTGPIGRFCGDIGVARGSSIDLTKLGCSFIILGDQPPRYFASADVENPSNEALTYDWRVYFQNGITAPFEGPNSLGSNQPAFSPSSPGSAFVDTLACWITVKVNAPDPSRSKGPLEIWRGNCTALFGTPPR